MSSEFAFSSTTIGGIAVANHIAMAPLTRSRAGKDAVPAPLARPYRAAYYSNEAHRHTGYKTLSEAAFG